MREIIPGDNTVLKMDDACFRLSDITGWYTAGDLTYYNLNLNICLRGNDHPIKVDIKYLEKLKEYFNIVTL